MRKTILFLSAAGLVIAAIMLAGCSTEKPWTTNPNIPLTLSLISGPADAAEVPADATISYSWSAIGGSGQILYQYRLNSGSWTQPADVNTATFTGLMPDSSYTFTVQAKDGAGRTVSVSRSFTIGEAAGPPPPDTIPPYVEITASPADGSFMATGSTISFSWNGYDSTGSADDLLYQYTFVGVTSEWTPARTVTFANIAAADPAVFEVVARDASGNMSDPASVTFTIKNASVLYVDDYLWLDPFQNVDRVKEREQKNFYREVLRGYAFAEWDIAAQGMPDSSYITNFSTVLFASDSYLGDASSTWWYDVGAVDGGVLRYYMENGGHLLAIGANILQWLYNNNPPLPGDFEYDWFGIDSTQGWDYWFDFTWAINAGNMAGLPDSMKIDVAKNGDQLDMAEDVFAYRDSAVVLFTKGLDVYGDEPEDYGNSVGAIFYPNGGEARSALIDFDGFSMPFPGMRETIHTILNQFGEGTGY